MRNIPTDQLRAKHREMWDWLSRNPQHDKQDWPGFAGIVPNVPFWCFACEYTQRQNYGLPLCTECPIRWDANAANTEYICEYNMKSAYYIYKHTILPSEKTNAARLIRDAWPDPKE